MHELELVDVVFPEGQAHVARVVGDEEVLELAFAVGFFPFSDGFFFEEGDLALPGV